MPLPVAAIPIITAGVQGLFSLFSGKSQGSATKEAANIQAASANRALDEQKRIFDLQRSDRQPYVDVSLGALGNLKNLAAQPEYMQLPAQRLGASSPTMPRQQTGAAMTPAEMGTLGQLGQARPATGAAMVPQEMGLFRAPDGSTRRMPLSLEQELLAKNVKRIQ